MSEPAIQFRVYGTPAPGGSKKAFVYRAESGKMLAAITDDAGQRNKDWRALVAMTAAEHAPDAMLTEAVAVTMRFILARPQFHFGTGRNAGTLRASAPRYPTTKPDVIKLARSTEDALKGVIWKDDNANVDLSLSKRYGERPGVEITITEIGDRP